MNTQLSYIEKTSLLRQAKKVEKLRLKKVSVSLALFLFLFISNITTLQAQDSAKNNFNLDLHLKNMHLWQGSVVTASPMVASSIEYVTDDQKFVAGLWGGVSFDGSYKEFSYYTTYRFTDNFFTQLISHNNYSNMTKPNMFSYNKYNSPNFLDIVFSYTLSDYVPATFMLSTILFGQAGDHVIATDGSVSNSYSNYAELNYRLLQNNNTQINAFVGGAFSLATEKTFYSDRPAIVNLGFTLTKKLSIFNKGIPVSGTAFWNPYTGLGALQIDISLF